LKKYLKKHKINSIIHLAAFLGVKTTEQSPEQVIKVNFNDKLTWFDDTKIYKPSQELNMHYFLQRKKQNYLHDTFILHAHPPNSIAYMGLNVNNIELNTIKQYFPEMNVGLIGKNVPFFNAGSEELAESCLNNLYNPYTMIGLKQHGTLSIGSDVNELIEHIETLEKYLDIYFKSIEYINITYYFGR